MPSIALVLANYAQFYRRYMVAPGGGMPSLIFWLLNLYDVLRLYDLNVGQMFMHFFYRFMLGECINYQRQWLAPDFREIPF